MNEFDIPIFKKVYELYKEFYLCLANFPRQHKYSLGIKIEGLILSKIELILSVGQSAKHEKLPILKKVRIKVDMTRVFLRLCHELRVIDNKKHVYFQEILDEVGRMIGGWIRYDEGKN